MNAISAFNVKYANELPFRGNFGMTYGAITAVCITTLNAHSLIL